MLGERFQRQNARVAGRCAWRGESGRPTKPESVADQVNPPI
jgi:hypothetical protein